MLKGYMDRELRVGAMYDEKVLVNSAPRSMALTFVGKNFGADNTAFVILSRKQAIKLAFTLLKCVIWTGGISSPRG